MVMQMWKGASRHPLQRKKDSRPEKRRNIPLIHQLTASRVIDVGNHVLGPNLGKQTYCLLIIPGVIKVFLMNEPFVRGRGEWWRGGGGGGFNHLRCSANHNVEQQKDALVGCSSEVMQFRDS